MFGGRSGDFETRSSSGVMLEVSDMGSETSVALSLERGERFGWLAVEWEAAVEGWFGGRVEEEEEWWEARAKSTTWAKD